MSKYVGNVLLMVNVASNWGRTKINYIQLPKLVDEYNTRGFHVLAFPCNQFGGQEPGTHEEIITFVKKIDIDMDTKLTFFEKADVNGANTREVYSFVKPKVPNFDGTTDIRWNFGTFFHFFLQILCFLSSTLYFIWFRVIVVFISVGWLNFNVLIFILISQKNTKYNTNNKPHTRTRC